MITRSGIGLVVALAAATSASAAALAQQAPTYGAQVTIDQAKKIAAAAIVEANKNNWKVAIAVVDMHGFPVYFERLDDVQTASPNIAIEKAKTAAMFRRPSRAFEEAISKGRVAVVGLPGVTPITGGVPIEIGGKIIGAVGVSGVTSDQDEQIAIAGVKAVQ